MTFQKKQYREIVDDMLGDIEKKDTLTDTHIGSVTRTLLETVGREVSTLYDEMDAAYNAGFIDTARGNSLDMVVAILGIQRKSAQFATGTATFSRRNPVQDVSIPRGTRVSTRASDPKNVKIYETTMNVRLPKGENEVEIPVKALTPGEAGMTDFETITALETPIIGVDKVINKKPTTIGTERETDEELRARARATVLAAGKATPEAIRNVVLGIPGVRGVTVNEMPSGIPGEIDVIIDGLDLTDKESPTYQRVEETIDQVRPAGIHVNIKSTDTIRTNIKIYLKLTDILRTDEEVETIIQKIKTRIARHIGGLNSGSNLVRNRMISAIFEIKDVYNIDEFNITTRKFDEKLGTLIDDTHKRLDPKTEDIEIGEYERAKLENLDIITQYTPKLIHYLYVDTYAEVSLTHKTISEYKVKERLESAMHTYLDKIRGGDIIEHERIKSIIGAIDGVARVQDLRLTGFHEETGVMIKNTKENIPTVEQEKPRSRFVELKVI
ncbi:baseplate J/gp47 family protein [[Eubacterium] cellulosolvens]